MPSPGKRGSYFLRGGVHSDDDSGHQLLHIGACQSSSRRLFAVPLLPQQGEELREKGWKVITFKGVSWVPKVLSAEQARALRPVKEVEAVLDSDAERRNVLPQFGLSWPLSVAKLAELQTQTAKLDFSSVSVVDLKALGSVAEGEEPTRVPRGRGVSGSGRRHAQQTAGEVLAPVLHGRPEAVQSRRESPRTAVFSFLQDEFLFPLWKQKLVLWE